MASPGREGVHGNRVRKRQKKNLAAATTETKRSQIQANIKDTKKRLMRLGCQ
jgi:hypothetical protein